MNEKLLQFIWQFQYYQNQNCLTTQGESLYIEKPGMLNTHQGPDFSAAIIRIGKTTWAGNIELHIHSSDWYSHGHEKDRRYANIILHVVWEDDKPVMDYLQNPVPTFVLASRISVLLLDRYQSMMETKLMVPCFSFLPMLHHLGWTAWKERLVAERLERKSATIHSLLNQSNCHWEEVFWWLLAANFGHKVNNHLFEQMAQSIPYAILSKHKNQIHQLEALLLGQANLLSEKQVEKYPVMLQKEYFFLKRKYGLSTITIQPAFLRMRPAAFPTVRLAQLAMLINQSAPFFSTLKEINKLEAVMNTFIVTANDYWNNHYRFNETSTPQPKQMGKQMAENILINTVVPILFAYGLYMKDEKYTQKSIEWLQKLPAEKNRITQQWQLNGIENQSALDSQALIELTNYYCMQKRCLNCAIGNKILKNGL